MDKTLNAYMCKNTLDYQIENQLTQRCPVQQKNIQTWGSLKDHFHSLIVSEQLKQILTKTSTLRFFS